MDEKDRVFARFKGEKPAASKGRELVTISRRARASGSKVVEVVRVRSGNSAEAKPRRTDTQVRAASWEDGFPTKQASLASLPAEMTARKATAPVTHVRPAWELPAQEPPLAGVEPLMVVRRGRGRPRKQIAISPNRRFADPFDHNDEGSNCLRCGYSIEPAREKRGLMTCTKCEQG